MKKQHGYLLSACLFIAALGFAHVVGAQEAPQKNEGKATIEGKAKDNNFDVRVQGGASREGQGEPRREGAPGPTGPAGQPGPQGPAGPSGGQVLGMDPTIALFVGLGVLAVVIIAIVAASRGREH